MPDLVSHAPPTGCDVLADAHCPCCGYALRGLTGRRCPECGTEFDPASPVNTFVVGWPRLLAWVLALQAMVIVPWGPIVIADTWSYGVWPYISAPFVWPLGAWLARSLLMSVVGVPAVVGLFRQRDWGRRLLVLYAFVALDRETIRRVTTSGHADSAPK